MRRRKNKYRRNRAGSRRLRSGTVIAIAGIAASAALGCLAVILVRREEQTTPEELLTQYMEYIPEQEYEQMYAMLHTGSSANISQEDFIKRNSAIYEGIEVQNMTVEILAYDEEEAVVTYQTSFDTVAGNISFQNEVHFLEGEDGYELVWDDSLIFPNLTARDKVKVSTTQAERGEILDRNGRVLAGKGTASSVGIVPGKLENRQETLGEIAELLETTPEAIEKKLSAQWVKEDSFVPVKTIPRVEETALMKIQPDEEAQKEQERHQKLLEIPGVMITDVEVREYPLKEAAAHLTGYVQGVTAEDLAKHRGEGYTSTSVIGRSGIEGLFEKELKGQNGSRIYMVDANGNEKEELAYTAVQHGEDIQLTIDAELQMSLYEQFQEDESCSVAIQPYTGEVLALVSTPSYDSNDFVLGLSDGQWEALSGDERQPMYNRFRQVWCPGSAFKPVTAAIGLESGAVDPSEDYGSEGLSWQKDTSWGSYYVTTLHAYEPVTLENALIYSDNIYFAKAALQIGSEELENSLERLGFHQELPFEIQMAQSQYSNTEHIETEIQLADSGYGQGQILMNPLHMACIYSAFCNEGNIIKPYLVYREDAAAEYWIPEAFSAETANRVLEGLKKVINDLDGTGYAARMDDVELAGKTGTAEIKASKEDTSGTELGWFAVFPTEKTVERPILLVSMTEDVKERGGSGYVVEKDRMVLLDLYEEAARGDKTDDLAAIRSIVNRFGAYGYPAVDSRNQVDMVESGQVEEFCEAAASGEEAEVTVFQVDDVGGFVEYGLQAGEGKVDVTRSYCKYENGMLQRGSPKNYPASNWNYTKEGYLMFSGTYFLEELYALTLSGAEEYTALRVQPLDETCRELNRRYILPIGYERNNMFLTDWDENDFGDLDFYDLYDIFYEKMYGRYVPYVPDNNLGECEVYQIPGEEFEEVIMTYFNIDSGTLQSKTVYCREDATYEYKPRGFEEAEYPEYPYPEVTSFTENSDGTITLMVSAVFPYAGDSSVYTHEVVVRPLGDGGVQYVSNRITSPREEGAGTWHTPRLTAAEWEEQYGGD